ncbi:MAG: hypothetical protein ACLPPV_11685 [Candidatus Korobacteraceae bacterium]|jgi:hypothetical protein
MSALVTLAVLGLGLSLRAQSGTTANGQSDAAPPRTMSPPIQIAVTGCLKQSNEGGYRLKDRNGTTWQLTSDTVDLHEHLNHVVSVTGKPMPTPQPGSNSPQEGTANAASKPSPGLRVLTLKMLSNSCTR